MTSKKALAKRAVLPRTSDRTKQFGKDWERHNKAARSDMAAAKSLMLLLIANDGPLPSSYKDHALEGEWKDHRDAHIHGDFILIYRIERQAPGEHVVFVRLGSHSELFG